MNKRIFTLAAMVAVAALSAHAATSRMGLPPREHADTEVVTNVPFSAAMDRTGDFNFSLSFNGTPSNNVEMAFGADSNADGVLSVAETEMAVVWDCGEWKVCKGFDEIALRAQDPMTNVCRSLEGRDIGELPQVEDPERKEACRNDFRLFCETYFPEVYALSWSDDQLRAISKIQTSVLKGGFFALAMSRGSGKSSLTESAAIWAMLYGHREFVVIEGASESAALEILDSVKTELEVNEHIAADFPEATYPIKRLEGIANRRTKFDFNGRMGWIVQPSVKPLEGMSWTWTMQWAEAFVDRTGVLDMLRKGYP